MSCADVDRGFEKGNSRGATVRALALDLDGTLTNAAKEVTPAVREALVRAADAGVVPVLASGRPLVGMVHVADSLNLGMLGGYVLSNNGARIVEWSTGRVVFEEVLDRCVVEAACAAAHEFGVDALVYDDCGLYAENPSAKYVEKERFNNSATATRVDDLLTAVTWAPNKVMVVGESGDLVPALAALRERLDGVANVFLSEPYFIEVTPFGIRKDAALAILARYMGLSLEEFMAIGDGLNDIPMLECCGVAVAMGNAYPEVKALADWVAPTNEEDGVAAAIEGFVLKGGAC